MIELFNTGNMLKYSTQNYLTWGIGLYSKHSVSRRHRRRRAAASPRRRGPPSLCRAPGAAARKRRRGRPPCRRRSGLPFRLVCFPSPRDLAFGMISLDPRETLGWQPVSSWLHSAGAKPIPWGSLGPPPAAPAEHPAGRRGNI